MSNNTLKTLRIYWGYCLRHKVALFLLISSITGASILNAIFPLFFKQFFDTLASPQPKESLVGTLVGILIWLAALYFLQWCFYRVASFVNIHFQSKIMAEIANDCFAYLHKHSFSFFQNNFVGSLVKKVKWFTKAFEDITDKVFWNLLTLAINLIIIIYVLATRNYLLALGVLVWLLIFFGINAVFIKYKLKHDIKRAKIETESTGLLADTVTNSHTIQLFNGYTGEMEKFGETTERLRKIRWFTWSLSAWLEAGQGFLMIFLEVGMLFLALRLWQMGILTVGDFVLIESYLVDMFIRVWDFGKIIRHIYETLADAEEMTEILQTPHEVVDIPGALALKVSSGEIEFKKVDFYYNQTRAVLRNFSLVIKGKERIALVGPSGAGKTTAIKLLLRVFNLTAGKILIDKQDIAKVTQESLRGVISLVPQDPILFHRTLKENIRYGRPKATDEDVMEASKKARCHDFISQLDNGYETYVGERGIKLSGGERQRVAIARAILCNSPILVLDEATSSLDSESELLIQEAISELMKEKTVLVIAHRLSTIRQMDRIILIDEGKIMEEGTHQELLKRDDGKYRKLWEIQAGSFGE
ncbi:MAG: ABC transporter ATP-binding protein [Candidatus Gribaldobacteria bacterium]|nr:ABC transporter ATP-binding protein [Candidatus Gribaldobacteria bacterium]